MDFFSLLFTWLLVMAWNVVKGLVLIVITYFFYQFLSELVAYVWEMIHPNSLKWFKEKFSKNKNKSKEKEKKEKLK